MEQDLQTVSTTTDNSSNDATTVNTSSVDTATDTAIDTSSNNDELSISEALDELNGNTKEDEPPTADTAINNSSKEDTKQENKKDNGVNCPDKFKNADGTPDVSKILTSYSELESNFTKKTQELTNQLKELQQKQEQERQQELAAQGYKSEADYAISRQVAQAISQGYLKYVNTTAEPEYITNLLYAYANNPSDSLLDDIEENFSTKVVKEVTKETDALKNQLLYNYQNQAQQEYTKRIQAEATDYVNKAYEAYPEWFERQEFIDFFGDALKLKGNSFEAGAFIKHCENIWNLAQKTLLAEQSAKRENNSAINTLVSQAPKNSNTAGFDMNNCTDEELALEISKYI